jgi:hypothetical protein
MAPLLPLDVLLQVHSRKDRKADDEAVRYLKKGRDKLRISEAFDNKRAKIAH